MGVCSSTPPAEPSKVEADVPLPSLLITPRSVGHELLVMDNKNSIQDCYAFDTKRPLGVGAYGSVTRGSRRRKTGTAYAIKTIKKKSLENHDYLRNEISIMKKMDHPNIVKLYETFEDTQAVYLVMELCRGAPLVDNIIGAGCFSEVQAAICMRQVIRAVKYMHDNFVCHRDLKPDNLMFLKKAPISENVLKVIDFGLSTTFETGKPMHEKVGCPYCVAPQVFAKNYDHACDLWSCGVIMYMILVGYPPFAGESTLEAIKKVRKGQWSFDSRDWKYVSQDAKNLIRMLLKMNPQERFTADQALDHAWIKEHALHAVAWLGSEFLNNLRRFNAMNKMQKAALHIIVGKLTDERIKAQRDTFLALDVNQDGMLTKSEIKNGLQQSGTTDFPDGLEQILMNLDSDNSGVIDYTEFLAATLKKKEYMKEHLCWQAFTTFDRNGDGVISINEFVEVLNSGSLAGKVSEDAVAEMVREADSNGDGLIDFEEFKNIMSMNHSFEPPPKPTPGDVGAGVDEMLETNYTGAAMGV